MKIPNQSIEVTARSLEEAKKIAVDQLGVSVDNLSFHIIEEKKRLFGLTQVRINAEVIQKVKEDKSLFKPKTNSKEETKLKTSSKRPLFGKLTPQESNTSPKEFLKENVENLNPNQSQEENLFKIDTDESSFQATVVATEEDAHKIEDTITHILKLSGLEIDIKEVFLNGRYVHFSLDGKDAGLLIGRRGDTLNALQFLLNVVASKKLANGVRVILDGDNYRERREKALIKLAKQVAGEVINRKEEAVLDALPSLERRIIHQVLEDFKGIKTYSEGEEPNRKVVIAPL